MRVVLAPIGAPDDALVLVDLERRTYLGLSRDRSYYHTVSPLDPADERSTLTCTCAGGRAHGHCWRSRQAEAHERELAKIDVDDWISRAAPGELVEAFGK